MSKEISRYSINGPNGEESLILETDGKNYKLRNEFGNMFFEFDLVSGLFFTQRFARDIESDAAEEVTNYLNELSKEDELEMELDSSLQQNDDSAE